MATLKELRIYAGLTQPDIATLIDSHTPLICNYENDVLLPSLEDCATLEKNFDTHIDWKEDLTPLEKHNTVQAIIELYERYPIPMVSEFVARVYRRNLSPENVIQFYAQNTNREEPLI